MKRLTLVRHGHAETRADGGDFYRELSPQGRSEASCAAAALCSNLPPPDLMIVSEALRSRETAQLLNELFRSPPGYASGDIALETSQSLYHASIQTLYGLIHSIPITTQHALIVGHNPGLSELAQRWTQKFSLDRAFGGLPTAGWCSATFDTRDWRSISSPIDVVLS
ncbi:MAG: hypothetical protein FJ196_01265 [Gammaproteobacteria bacterium]|nr:hypothetical protein [Gammaproteobacteria bacterium]